MSPSTPPANQRRHSEAWTAASIEGLFIRPLMRRPETPLKHALTIDLEDWGQAVHDLGRPVSDRYLVGTERILELLDAHGVKATFFVLGNVAEHSPETIRRLHRAGHEIQTHGYSHTPMHRQRPHEFRADVIRAKKLLEDLTGQGITGYRAPRFSITTETIWALDVLASCGFTFDSSIFPMRIRGYGIAGWCARPHRVKSRTGAEIIELPVATGSVCGKVVPLGGGGYFRLLPYALIRRGLRRIEAEDRPAIIYCHPHEFDPDGLVASGCDVTLRQRLHQGIGRRRFAGRIDRLLRDFRFGPIRDLLPGPSADNTAPMRPAQVQ